MGWPMIAVGLAYTLMALALPAARYPIRFIRLMIRSSSVRLPVPVWGVSRDRLSDSWGALRSGGRRHEGIDIFARRNTPVVSVTDGIVYRKGWNALGGRIVMITGPGGYHHYYAHLESFAKITVGDWVDSGRVIGYVGDSGNARGTPTHLHYGIYKLFGGAINPYPLLAPDDARTR